MHGVIHDSLKMLFEQRFGEEKFKELLKESGSDANGDFMMFHQYTDEHSMKLILCSCKVLGLPIDDVLDVYGEFFYHYAVQRGFAKALQSYGHDVESFLSNLNYHHYFITSFMYGSLAAPSFRCEKKPDGSLFLHYSSARKGLHPIVKGLAKECVKHLFGQTVELELKQRVDFKDSTKWVDGAVFYIRFISTCGSVKTETQRIDIDRGLADARRDILHMEYLISKSDFRELFPFYVVFDKDMSVVDAGDFFLLQCPELVNSQTNVKLGDCFALMHPGGVPLTWKTILAFITEKFILRLLARTDSSLPSLRLSGHMVQLQSGKHICFVCSPRFSTLDELLAANMSLSDIPLHDTTRDLVLLCDQRANEIGVSKQLEMTTMSLQKMSKELESEKARTEGLLYEILPKQIAQKLMAGETIDAAYYKEVTILFSDIVQFTVMTMKSQPIQIVGMLNSLFTRFDKLTNMNGVYKVETIGDAYMVCGGAPEEVENHAERVANMALGMHMACKCVVNPVTNQPLRIRVGINSGPVLTGVVGKKCPRFCLFGDTVNTASRMESHGVPERVHASESTKKLLDGKPFEIEFRGNVTIKGKGFMNTYFVVRNTAKPIPEMWDEAPDHSKANGAPANGLPEEEELYPVKTRQQKCSVCSIL